MAVDFRLGDAFPARTFFAEQRLVFPHALRQVLRDINTPHRHAQLSDQAGKFREVMIEENLARHPHRVTGRLSRNEGIAVAVAVDPGAEFNELGQFGMTWLLGARVQSFHLFDAVFQFRIKPRQSVEQHHLEIVEAHVDLILHGRTIQAHFIGLPERGDLRQNLRFKFGGFRVRKRKLIEPLKTPGDAAALETNRVARDLGWMCGEHRRNANVAERVTDRLRGEAGRSHPLERAPERSFGKRARPVQMRRAPPPLAMVRLRQVGQLEINGKRFSQAVSIFDRKAANDLARLEHKLLRLRIVWGISGRRLAVLDQQPTQLLDCLEKLRSFLFDQHAPEQDAQRTDIPAERRFFRKIASGRAQLGQAFFRNSLAPQRIVSHALF